MKRMLALVAILVTVASSVLVAQSKFPLKIICSENDADVYINGTLYTKTKPNLAIQLPVATYSVKIAKAGFVEFNATVSVTSKGATLSATLQKLAQTPTPSPFLPQFPLNVTANVQGAEVYFNNKLVGKTPYGANVTGGDYLIIVKAPGYADFSQRIRVNGPQQVNAQLQPTGAALTINANVPQAQVFINGNPAGTAPFSTQVPMGSYAITVRAPGYVDFSQNVVVNGPVQVNAVLQALSHSLTIGANVPNAQVFINGNPAGNAPFKSQVPPGSYTVTVRAVGYADFSQNVVVNGPVQVNALLQALNYALTVNANVPGADVFINGSPAGKAPFSTLAPGGTYTIVVRALGYSDYTQTVALGGPTQINAMLQPLAASWKMSIPEALVNKNLKGGHWNQIQIYVDGQLQKGDLGQVMPGKHLLRIVSGGLAYEAEVEFVAGKQYSIEPAMGFVVK